MFAFVLAATLAAQTGAAPSAHGAAAAAAKADPLIARGRYLVNIAGCNDCHTAGYAQSAGKVPEATWLAGETLGWNGAWGTTYAPNLRLRLNSMDETTWLAYARALSTRPPMPYWVLNQMDESDLRAIWRFVHTLGATGTSSPPALPPGMEPQGPVIRFPAPPAGATKP
jgi:mono/diheme cytochrome c family protein